MSFRAVLVGNSYFSFQNHIAILRGSDGELLELYVQRIQLGLGNINLCLTCRDLFGPCAVLE